MRVILRLMAFSLLLGSLGGCGGSEDQSDQGVWKGKTTDEFGIRRDAIAVMQQGGYGFVFDDAGTYYVLPPIANSRSYFGDMTRILRPGAYPVSVLPVQTFISAGHGTDDTMDLAYTFGKRSTANVGNISLVRDPSSSGLASLTPGNWHGYVMSTLSMPGEAFELFLQADGYFDGSDGVECNWVGTLTPLEARSNLFSVTTSTTSNSRCGQGPSFAGIGYMSMKDELGLFGNVPGTYLYMGFSHPPAYVDDDASRFVVLKLQ